MKDSTHIEEKVKNQEGMGLLYILKASVTLFLVLVVTSCSSLPEDKNWNTSKEVRNQNGLLRTGDIIIKNKKPTPMSWYGHAAMMIDDRNIGDYPKVGIGYYEIDSYSWLYEKRDVVVLRYKHFDEEFKVKLLENIEENKDKGYWVTMNKRKNKRFYCSQFIWYIYWKTAKDLGYELDLDSDGGPLVFPYDFLESDDLIQVEFGSN